jgi:Bacterial Ig domain
MRNLFLLAYLLLMQLITQAQTLTPPFQENFNNVVTTTNGWYVPIPSGSHDFRWYANAGDTLANGDTTGGLRMKLNTPNNYVASPGINLIAGKTYTAIFKERVQSSPTGRRMKIGYNTARSLTGATFFYDFACPNNIYTAIGYVQQTPTFSIPTTGVYYLVYYFYNADGSSSYIFTYLDDCGVEETVYPTVSINTPINNFSINENYADTTKVNIDVTAADADGSISKVEYYRDSILLGTSTTAPHQFTWKDPKPGQYKIYVKATDNRNNVKVSDTSIITVKFKNGTLSPYVQWDFDVDNPNGSGLNYWQFPPAYTNAQYTLNSFFRGSQCLYINSVAGTNNYAISPSVSLKAGVNYSLEFLANTRGGEKIFKFMYTKTASLADTVLIDTTRLRGILPTSVPEFDYIRNKPFTVPTDGVYNIVIYYPSTPPWSTFNGTFLGNIKSKFDMIRVIGSDLNVGPTSKLTYPTAGLNYAENAKIIFASDAKDLDGTVVKVEYYANDVKVAESSVAPFSAIWNTPPIGVVNVYAKAFDNSGGYGISPTIVMTGVANQFKAISFLGTTGNDEIRGAVIKENNDIVYAANIGNINVAGAVKYYLNGATDASAGAILILSSDGKILKSITRICTKISDLSKDRNDNLYIAAVGQGVFKINATATVLLYSKLPSAGKNVHRIDVGPTGKTVYLEVSETNIDDGTITGANILYVDKDGNNIASCGSISQYTSDVCIDEASQTIIGVGFKNFNTLGEIGGQALPVYVPVIRGFAYTGAQKWLDYDWGSDETITTNTATTRQWLNLSNNNMADARLNRCTIGKDGKLYVAGQVYGGNHIFRYDPKDVILAGKMATGGDNWFNLNNTGTEIHSMFGRYEPSTGDVIRTQTFTARLPSTAGNSLICELGNIDADELGNCYLTGTSAYGFPMSVEYQPGEYTGGGFIMKSNYSLNTRLLSVRFTSGGYGKALAVKKSNQFTFGGYTNSPDMYVTNPTIQALNGGGYDAFYGVINDNSCSLPDSATSIAPASFERKALAAYNLMVDNNCKPIAKIIPIGTTSTTAISDSVRVKLFIDPTQNADYVKRHFEITPFDNAGNVLSNANTKTGTVTLYFSQQDFDDYNAVNTAKLPTGVADLDGIGRILIDKYPGISSDGTGLPATYTGTKQTINPADVNIIWNAIQSRWEITFDVAGFSGFFVKGFNTYIFNGNGNWTDAANWKDGNVPPLVLLDKSEIIIDPIVTGECFLNLSAAQIQEIKTGASLNVMPGKKLRLPAGLTIE